MPNSIDFYKGIFLHVIPVRIIVSWSKALHSPNVWNQLVDEVDKDNAIIK